MHSQPFGQFRDINSSRFSFFYGPKHGAIVWQMISQFLRIFFTNWPLLAKNMTQSPTFDVSQYWWMGNGSMVVQCTIYNKINKSLFRSLSLLVIFERNGLFSMIYTYIYNVGLEKIWQLWKPRQLTKTQNASTDTAEDSE